MQSMRASKTFSFSLAISLIVHGAVIAMGVSYVIRHSAPQLSLQGGSGGDGIRPGEISFIATGSDFDEPNPFPQPLVMDIVSADPQTPIPEIQVPSTLSAETSGLPDAAPAPIGIGPNNADSHVPDFPSHAAAQRSDAADPATNVGNEGLGGDGLLRGAPFPSARNKPPRYPVEARRKGYEGVVVLEIDVLDSGKVGAVKVGESSGYAILDKAAIEAARKWTFEPSVAGTKLAASSCRVPVNFFLH